jgi:heat shock protein 5
VKSSLNDPEKLKGKVSAEDEQTLEEAIKDGQSFLDSNPEAEKEEYDEKRK